MDTHPDIALWMIKQRGERIRREVHTWRLFHKQRKTRPSAPVWGAYQALCEFVRARGWRPSRPLGQH